MMNLMEINGQKAVVMYDPEIDMFRGEFVGLSGGADFYASDIETLHKEGERSLEVYLDGCRQRDIAPFKSFSGKLNVRLTPEVHQMAAEAAAASHVSLNQFIARAVAQAVE